MGREGSGRLFLLFFHLSIEQQTVSQVSTEQFINSREKKGKQSAVVSMSIKICDSTTSYKARQLT